ncbi:MAG: ATP-dependent DNA helicase DinG [Oleiphilaceae bacterium]|jgi:ATP-dependent DNA helicase DinG
MLTEAQKKLIQTTYRKFTSREGFRPRYGQRVMIAEIAKYLGSIEENEQGQRSSSPAVCVVEAGTGTGKTLAYCMAVLPLALDEKRKVILSTATTALQDQVMSKDLPELAKYSGLEFTYALAKGRGRYLCLSKLDQQLDTNDSDLSALPLFLMPEQTSKTDKTELEIFFSKYASGSWDGDRDTWEDVIEPDVWRTVSTDNQQCSKRRCSYFNSCPYYVNRRTWDEADLIVVNHDLLLSDLALGGGVLLPPPETSILVLDEAHHLADKALNHFTVHSGLKTVETWLKSLSKTMVEFSPYLGPGNYMGRHIEDISQVGVQLHDWFSRVYDYLAENIVWDSDNNAPSNSLSNSLSNTRRFRFKQGIIPEDFHAMACEIRVLTASLCRLLDDIRSEVTKAVDEKSDSGLSKEEGEQWFPVFGSLCDRAENIHELWMFYSKSQDEKAQPSAKWLVLRDYENAADIGLYGSPLSAGGLLHEELWKKIFAAVLTSATLTALGTFDRLTQKAGLPKDSVYHQVSSPFDFQNVARLLVPKMKACASNPEAHTAEIVERLDEWVAEHKAVLVLFSSRKQMNDVHFKVNTALKKDIMTQDEVSKQELVRRHKETIDSGKRSVLFGLASLAEGIDLPGDYLTHVIIAKIPFSVPNDPLEESISEWLEAQGRNPFMEVSVPDASLKLIQACGRLIRTEEDEGQVTILDTRLLTRRYGNLLINSLPPYQRIYD